MKTKVLCVMVLVTLLLAGCGSKNDANEKNLSEATNAYLAKKGQLCLGLASKWPVDLQDSDRGQGIVRGSQMAALEKVDLVRSHETEIEITPLSGTRPVKAKVLRYELTDDGKKFYQEKEVPGLIGEKESRGDICFGRQALDTVVRTEGPITVGNKKEMTLYYTYKIENLADWAKNPDIQRTFPGIVSTLNGAGKTTLNQNLTLTDQGWEAQ
ncbi:MAG: hypothetical protein WA613_16560 [Candidatus Acidiferrales bacterium]